jgi:HNH endonuclease
MSTKHYPTIEYVRQCLRYEDGHLFWLVRPRDHFASQRAWGMWNARYSGKEAGYQFFGRGGRHPRFAIILGNKPFLRHIVVWALHHDEWLIGIDHKNRDSLDDKIENLRPATPLQNAANCGHRKTNRSGYKGVSWHAAARKWQASIQVAGHSMGLGLFDDPAEAHAAYVEAATKHNGEFACTE